jgi:hypothetical protein
MKKYIVLFFTITGSLFVRAQQQLPNPSFENWTFHNTSLPYEEPDVWFGTSVSCVSSSNQPPVVCETSTVKTTNAQAGLYAAKLVNVANSDGSISKGQLIYSYGSDGYVTFTDRPKTLTGYYKFNQTAADVVNIIVTITGPTSTDIVAYGTLDLTASKTNYTLFTVPLQYFSQSIAPKDIYVVISFNDNASASSNFTVDNLVLTYTTTPTSTATPVSAGINFFPNPGKDKIHFEQPVKNISIKSANGASVLTYSGDNDEVNISSLDKGIYIISYEHNETLIHGKLIVE